MRRIKIGNRLIGEGCKPFIIAEAGINHNGELSKAYKMIKVAKEAGADAIKFQTFKAEEFIADPKLTYTYKSQGKKITESMLKMFKKYELKRDEWFLIKEKCNEAKITFLSTPQNRSDLDLLLEIGIPAIKVGSDDFTNTPLLKSYAQTELPMIVSSGMSDLAEVYQALKTIGSLDGYPTVLMVCTSEYPTLPEDVNLLKLKTLSSAFPTVVLGFSDHTQGSLTSSLAVALGASVLEKHFTLNHNLPGPDHWFSADPRELSQLVQAIRYVEKALGSCVVKPTLKETKMRKIARRSIVAAKDIKIGEFITEEMLSLKKPGIGLAPKFIEYVINKKSKVNIKKNELITFEKIE